MTLAPFSGRLRLRWASAVLAAGAVAVVGAATLVATQTGAGATVTSTVAPTLSVSPASGPVGSLVTVVSSFPADDGCGLVTFQPPSPGSGTDVTLLPSISPGSQRFVVPSGFGGVTTPPGSAVSPGRYLFSLSCDTSNLPATGITVSVPFTVTTPPPSRFVGMTVTNDHKGYWLAQAGGGVFSYGDAVFHGSLPGEHITPAAPIVGIAATPTGKGYWLLGADGGVFAFGDAAFKGSGPGASTLGSALSDEPFVAFGATPDGGGYDEVGVEGNGLAFGDATTSGGGSLAIGVTPRATVSALAVSPTGTGAWFVGRDGGVFTVAAPGGSAPGFFGSLPGEHVVPVAPVVGMAATATGKGYWLLGADGGVFTFGDAAFFGSAGSSGLAWQD
jgi:hypothetical protein